MTSLNQTDTALTHEPGFINKLAQTLLEKRLSKIPHGILVIDDGDESKCFGVKQSPVDISAKIVIEDASAYRDIAFGGSIGAAESFMLGRWSSPDLVKLIRLMSINIDFLNSMDESKSLVHRFIDKACHWMNRNTTDKARRNISAHYDLSNEFFSLFLDPEMMYSSAMFPRAAVGLDEAAVYKLDAICKKLDLQPSDHLLEIGTGWGGMAIYAAQNYGCRVTTTTISKQQYQAACERVKEAGLQDRVNVIFKDYRELEGRYDKLVSIEMIEAVGQEFYKQYFSGCSALLKPDGLMLIQAITIPDQRYRYALNSVDFIQRYIFPGGSLPGHEIIMSSLRQHTDMQMVGMEEIGEDYARTLEIWRQRFLAKLDKVQALGFDDVFVRMWDYYLCYCQGAFEERVIGTSQLVFAKPEWRQKAAG
ncbi:MAG: class I SAM-dependent methyltransferase [Gammaproteobacteria bacterium]|nr:class I SAM-dependent methyltransferase [Gammaproteobacteria bacterium]